MEQRNIYHPVPFPGGPAIHRHDGHMLQTAVIRLREKPPYHSRFFEKSRAKISLYQKMAL